MKTIKLLRDIGEKELVNKLQYILGSSPLLVSGRGNDSTALDIGLPNEYLLVTCDRCPTPLAYKVDETNLEVWGRLAITCVASDLLASGGNPFAFLISLLLNRNLEENKILDMMRMAQSYAEELGASVVAGDTKEAASMNIVTTGLALVSKNKLVTRKGAKAGDIIILTGPIGKFTAAQTLLSGGMKISELRDELAKAVLYPEVAHKAAIPFLKNVTPTAGMDTSDGLLCSLYTMCEETDLGVDLYETALPIPDTVKMIARETEISALRFAFGTGDWQIVYSVSPEDWLDYQNKQLSGNLYPIGKFSLEPGVRLNTRDNQILRLNRIEQQHFLETWADRGYLEYLLTTPLFIE